MPAATAPGTYTGSLTVAVVGGAESHVIPMTVKVLAQKPCLSFAPGSSQATHYSTTGCPQQAPIATSDKQGNLSLDFGDEVVGSQTSWSDVFRITSSAPAALKVSFTPSGAIAPLIASVGFASDKTGGALNPKQTRSVAVKIVVPAATAPGTYTGSLTVAVVGGAESHVIPMTVKVLAQKPCLSFAPGSSQATHYSTTGCPQQAPIATSDKQGNLSLDFGDEVVGTEKAVYDDVLDLTSTSSGAATLTFTLSGPVATLVRGVGFRDAHGDIIHGGVTLAAGQTQKLAFELCVPAGTALADLQGTVTFNVRPASGGAQLTRLPVAVEIVGVGATADPTPSSSPPSSVRPTVAPSTTPSATPSTFAKPSPSPSPSSSASPTASASASPTPSGSPSSSTPVPSASPSSSLNFWLGPIWLAIAGLDAL